MGYNHARPEISVDEQGYLATAEHNLLSGLALEQVSDELDAGAGQELQDKFRAVHSSSALAINSFAPLRCDSVAFDIGEHRDLHVEGFERRFPTGLARAMPPHLDVVARGPDELVAIESKCLEYLESKTAKFSERYASEIADDRATSPGLPRCSG